MKQMDESPRRTVYRLTSDRIRPPCGLGVLGDVCACVVDAFGQELGAAYVDGFSDCRSLPANAVAALEGLRSVELSRSSVTEERSWFGRLLAQRSRGTSMAVEFDLGSPAERSIFLDFAPYSIHAEVERTSDATPLLVLHDCGQAVLLDLTGGERRQLLDAFRSAGLSDVRLSSGP